MNMTLKAWLYNKNKFQICGVLHNIWLVVVFFSYKYVSVNSLFSFVSVLQFSNPFTTWSDRLVPSFVISLDYIMIRVITGLNWQIK